MTAITVIAILAAAATIYGFVAMDSCERIKVAPKGKKKKYQVQEVPETGILFMVIMAVALIVRYIAAAKYFGNETDMNCFIAWGDMIINTTKKVNTASVCPQIAPSSSTAGANR